VARAPSPAWHLLRRQSQGMPEGHGGRKLVSNYRCRMVIEGTLKLGRLRQRFFNRRFGQRRHQFVTGHVGMQAVVGKLTIQ
jgi:hypothetical protein